MTEATQLVRRMWMGHVPNGKELELLAKELAELEAYRRGTQKPSTEGQHKT